MKYKTEHFNYNDINTLMHLKTFKYVFWDTTDAEVTFMTSKQAVRQIEDMLTDFQDMEDMWTMDDYELTYPGDRDSPPEYELRDDAEMKQMLDDTTTTGSNIYIVQVYPDQYIYAFNTVSQINQIITQTGYTETEIAELQIENTTDVPTDTWKANMCINMDEHPGISVDEVKDLFGL